MSSDTIVSNPVILQELGTKILVSASGVTAAMTAGAVTTTNTLCVTTSLIIYSRKITGGTTGQVSVVANNGNFVLTSTSNTETSTFSYIIINP